MTEKAIDTVLRCLDEAYHNIKDDDCKLAKSNILEAQESARRLKVNAESLHIVEEIDTELAMIVPHFPVHESTKRLLRTLGCHLDPVMMAEPALEFLRQKRNELVGLG